MSLITDLLGTTGLSSDAQQFYNTVKQYTDNNYGYISGKENILALFNNQYTEAEIVSFCHSLELQPGFRYEEKEYKNVPYIQNIWIDNN